MTVAKPDLGTKRLCPNCGTKYYDLNRDPIICPHCGTQFEVSVSTRARPVAAAKVVEEEDVEVPVEKDAEFVTLEEADEEAADSGAVAVEGDDEEAAEAEDDATFLEEEDEEGDDVTDIIGGVEDEEP
jgi:uncharacterized protein (TIGR02300 family)